MARVTNRKKQERLRELRIMSELLEVLRVQIHEGKTYDGLVRAKKIVDDERERVLSIMREAY